MTPDASPLAREPHPADAIDPLVGRTLAERYRLISCLGRGATSAVYLGRHVVIERLSAIKVLHHELAAHPVHRERFLREARAVNRINHPNIVEITDYGEVELLVSAPRRERRALAYLVMEYVPGETLSARLREGPMHERRVVPIVLQLVSALARAHRTGVVHRDVKPDNVLLLARRDWVDFVKLTDFGVARLAGGASTYADHVVGTPGYVAPEYLVGEPSIDGRADLFSVGVLMHRALVGEMPWPSRDAAGLLAAPMIEEPAPIGRESVAPRLAEVVRWCLRRRPDDRPRDAHALLDALGEACPWAKEFVPGDIASSSRDPPRSATEPSRERTARGTTPRWGEHPPREIATAWQRFFDAVENATSSSESGGAPGRRIHELLAAFDAAVDRLESEQAALDALAERGRDFRATLGTAIDTIARDLSRAHARVLDLKQRRVELHLRRRNTEDPAMADAILWQEAAIDDELRRAQRMAADLGHQIGALQDALFARNESHEAETLRASGEIEGVIAAMTRVHRELEMLADM